MSNDPYLYVFIVDFLQSFDLCNKKALFLYAARLCRRFIMYVIIFGFSKVPTFMIPILGCIPFGLHCAGKFLFNTVFVNVPAGIDFISFSVIIRCLKNKKPTLLRTGSPYLINPIFERAAPVRSS
jgi:hypothetical protein